MKKLLYKSSIFILILILLEVVLGQLYFLIIDKENNDEIGKFDKMPNQIEIAVFGSSHGEASFDFRKYSDQYFNFALSAQTPRYDYQLMKEYSDNISENATLLITISYFSFFQDEKEKDFQSKQNRYYSILSYDNMIEGNVKKMTINKLRDYMPLVFDRTNLIIFNICHSFHAINESDIIWYQGDALERQKEHVIYDHQKVMENNFPDVNNDMFKAYESMLKMAENNNWNVVFVTPPFPDVYNEMFDNLFDSEFYSVFYDKVNLLKDKYNVQYLDYSHDKRFQNNYDLFKNIDHLNFKGQQYFSSIVIENIT